MNSQNDYNALNLEVLRKFKPAFDKGRRAGNAVRAYHRTAHVTGDQEAGIAVAAGILFPGENVKVRSPGWKAEKVLWPERTISSDGTATAEPAPWEDDSPPPWGFGTDKRIVD